MSLLRLAAGRPGVAGVALFLALSGAPWAREQPYLIRGARVVVGDGEVRESADVLLEGGLIAAVGVDLELPPGSVEVSGEGRTVYPGLIDAFSTLGIVLPEAPDGDQEEEAAPPGNAGEEPDFSRDARPRTRDANRRGLHPERRARDHLLLPEKDSRSLRRAGFAAILATPADGYLGGQSCLVNLTGAAPRTAIVSEPGLLYAHLRASRGGGYPGTLMAVLAHVRQFLHDAGRHREWQEGFARQPQGLRRPPSDTSLAAAQAALDGSLRVMFEADTENDILRALDLAREFGLTPVIVGGRDAWRVADRLAAEQVPVVARLAFPDRPERKGARKKKDQDAAEESDEDAAADPTPDAGAEPILTAGLPAEETEPAPLEDPTAEWEIDDPVLAEPIKLYEDRVREWEEQVGNVARLLEAGVPVALTTLGSSTPKDFRADLATAVEHGLATEDALRALCVEPARVFGVERILGQVAPGRIANVVVVEGDLLDPKAKILDVFVDGRRFEPPPEKKKKKEGDGDEPTAKVGGTWTLTGDGPMGPFEATLILTQEGEDLEGTFRSRMGERELSGGSIVGQELDVSVTFERDGESFEIQLEGTVEGTDLSGTLELPFGDPIAVSGQRSEEPEEQS